ncbi:hypothetical protein KKC59_01945, partial [bacterium]|nr:hypothetical protein [bacterium]
MLRKKIFFISQVIILGFIFSGFVFLLTHHSKTYHSFLLFNRYSLAYSFGLLIYFIFLFCYAYLVFLKLEILKNFYKIT